MGYLEGFTAKAKLLQGANGQEGSLWLEKNILSVFCLSNYYDLHYPADADNPDEWSWGEFYLHSEECEPGYYDFVFTYDGKAIATLLTRFYGVAELSGKSDEELEKLMHE